MHGRWSLVLILLAASLRLDPLCAEIYRWDTGELIPGTEEIEPGPGTQLREWNTDERNLRFGDFSTTPDLSDASFALSWLENARFNQVKAIRSIFAEAMLSDADFRQANLTRAYFRSATLEDADLRDAVVVGANLSDTTARGLTKEQFYSTHSYKSRNLVNIDLFDNDLTGWNLSGMNLAGAVLGGNLTDVILSQSNLSGVFFRRGNLTNADLSGATLISVDLGATTLANTNFNDAIIDRSRVNVVTENGFTADQLYATASYKSDDLQGIMLSGNDLTGWNFAGKDLSGAQLRSTLTGADFRDATITRADFSSQDGLSADQLYSTASYRAKNLRGVALANVSGWNLSGQDLTDAKFFGSVAGADMSNAIVRGADFSNTSNTTQPGFTSDQLYATASYKSQDLLGINLQQNDLSGWNFAGQNLRQADFSFSQLADADFRDAHVNGTIFHRATDRGFTQEQLQSTASFRAEDLSRIVLRRNDLSGWNFTNQNLTGANFREASLAGTDFRNAIVKGAVFQPREIRGSLRFEQLASTASYKAEDLAGIEFGPRSFVSGWNLSGQNLTRAIFVLSDMTGTNLSEADLTGAYFHGSTLAEADFTNAEIRGADFVRTVAGGFTSDQLYSTASYQRGDLEEVGFSSNVLSGWSFAGQNLKHASFVDTQMAEVDFSDANLFGADFRSALGFAPDASTNTSNLIWPNGEIRGLVLGEEEVFRTPRPSSTAQVTVTQELTMTDGSILETGFFPVPSQYPAALSHDALYVSPGTPVQLGGTLRIIQGGLGRLGGPNYAGGLAMKLFDWPDLAPNQKFASIELPAGAWDLSLLYVTGEIRRNVAYRGDGDFNVDGLRNVDDVDQLARAIRVGRDITYDITGDRLLDQQDLQAWVHDFQGTWFGDANLDGEFNSSDLVEVFVAGAYETGDRAGWAAGDWDASGLFDSGDLVAAFADGGHEQGPRIAANAVPEPTSFVMLITGLIGVTTVLRTRRSRV